MSLQIRPATPDDAERLAAVYRSAYAENRELGFPTKAADATAEQVADWIRDARVFVADDGDPVGAVRIEETAPDRVKLSRLAVRDDRKGEGVGTDLLDHAERVAHEDGYDELWLTTPPEHPYLGDLYRSRGYERTGDYPLEYRDYDEMRMAKPL